MTKNWRTHHNQTSAGRPSRMKLLSVLGMVFADRDPLSNDTRRRIYEYIMEQPGVHLRAIARGVKLDTNHTKYHLIYLEQCNLICSERVHGHWAFFPIDGDVMPGLDAFTPSERAQLFLLRKPVPRTITRRLLEVGEGDHTVLQDAAKVSASTLYYHLRRMEEKELIVSRKVGRSRVWRLGSPDLCQRFLATCYPTAEHEEEQPAKATTSTPWLLSKNSGISEKDPQRRRLMIQSDR